jgi:tetratricopeptide (TPR) repeat protein
MSGLFQSTKAPPPGGISPARKRVALGAALVVLVGLLAYGGRKGYFAWKGHQHAERVAACKAASQASRWDDLEKLAGEWLADDPNASDARVFLASAAQGRGDLEKAALELDRLPDGYPKIIEALLERSTLLFEPLNRPIEAVATCERILKIEPGVVPARRRIIFFYALTRQRARMIAEIRKAIELGCETPDAYVYLLGADWLRFSNGYELNDRWLAGDPESELFLVARAIHFEGTQPEMLPESEAAGGNAPRDAPEPPGGTPPGQAAGDRPPRLVAEEVLGGYLRRFPQNVELLDYHLEKASSQGDVQRVIELLSQARGEEAAGDSRFWRYRGWVLLAQDRPEEAAAAYARCLELFPFDWKARHQYAQVLRRLGRTDDVERQSQLGVEGKELEKLVVALPDAASLTPEVMDAMVRYVEHCGDQLVLRGLALRISPKE